MNSSFLQRKKDILSKADKSSKGKWDKKIIKLCEKINFLDNYYTTSSCAGRILIIKDISKKGKNLFEKIWHDKVSWRELREELNKILKRTERGNFKFKQEPCIIHVACDSLEDAEIFLNKARLAGWKRSGIIAVGNRLVVEALSTEKLEFPIIRAGKLLVDENFLKIVIKKSNENLEKSWKKIEDLRKKI